MTGKTALVTGASGFIGRHLVLALARKGYQVRAGSRTDGAWTRDLSMPNVKPVHVDILDRSTLHSAMAGADIVFHLAALVNSSRSRSELYRVNVEGTRNVWECAADCRLDKAIYCSSTAVYGLLSRKESPITEEMKARAIEPYGRSKLLGEEAALDVALRTGLLTTIIRPVAVFGPEEHTPFGKDFRDAAFSKVLVAGGFQDRCFSYVHVEDVSNAAVHLIERNGANGEIFNIAVDKPVSFEEAFDAYRRILARSGRMYAKVRMLANVSSLLHRVPRMLKWLSSIGGEQMFFSIWHPGFDLNYSSAKLLGTSFQLRYAEFESVLASCVRRSSR